MTPELWNRIKRRIEYLKDESIKERTGNYHIWRLELYSDESGSICRDDPRINVKVEIDIVFDNFNSLREQLTELGY